MRDYGGRETTESKRAINADKTQNLGIRHTHEDCLDTDRALYTAAVLFDLPQTRVLFP